MNDYSTEHVRRHQQALQSERQRTARAMYDDLGKGPETFGTAGYWVNQFLRPTDNCDDNHTAHYRTMLKRAIIERETCPGTTSLEIFADNRLKNCVVDRAYGVKTLLHAGFDIYTENFETEHKKFGSHTGLNPKQTNNVIKYFSNYAEVRGPSSKQTLIEIGQLFSGNKTSALMANARMSSAQTTRETLNNVYVHCVTDLFGDNPSGPDNNDDDDNNNDDPVFPRIKPTVGVLTY